MRTPSSSRSKVVTPCCNKIGLKRGPWTPEEDEILTNYVSTEGEGRWRTLPKKAGLFRCGKSCRLRWMNYLRPSVKRGHITLDEEDLILRLHRLLGNRWSLIAGRIPGRTDNEIKNYWNTHLSKKLISQGIDPRTHKPLILNPNSSGHDHDDNPIIITNQANSSSSPSSSSKLLNNNNLNTITPYYIPNFQMDEQLLTSSINKNNRPKKITSLDDDYQHQNCCNAMMLANYDEDDHMNIAVSTKGDDEMNCCTDDSININNHPGEITSPGDDYQHQNCNAMLANYSDDDPMNIAVSTKGDDEMNCYTDDIFSSSFLNSLINEDMFHWQNNQQMNGTLQDFDPFMASSTPSFDDQNNRKRMDE